MKRFEKGGAAFDGKMFEYTLIGQMTKFQNVMNSHLQERQW